LGAACRGSVREEEVREVLGEHVGSRSGERVAQFIVVSSSTLSGTM
jgi:hypothetical protein